MSNLFPSSAIDKQFVLERFSHIDATILSELKPYINEKRLQNFKTMLDDLLFRKDERCYQEMPLKVTCMPIFSSADVEVIGSASEGLSVTEYSEAGNNEEIDITAILKTIQGSESPDFYFQKDFVEVIHCSQFPGHVYLKIHHPETASEWTGLTNIASNTDGTLTEFYISPEGFTDELFLMNCYRESIENFARLFDVDNTNDLSSLMNKRSTGEDSELFPNQGLSEASDSVVSLISQEGPAIKYTLFDREKELTFQYDCAFAIWCRDWPQIAKPWKGRHRRSGWPPPSMVHEITKKGCLLVPKSPFKTITNLEWRLSFCLVERDLIKTLSEDQKLCYKVLKCIWRRVLKPPAGKALQSYHLKTVFLWECEDIAREDWERDKAVCRVMGLLQRLETYLVYEYCPHYIIPENNLFSDIDKDVLFRAAQRVQTAIVRADVVWINNECLTVLGPNKTRIGMQKGIQSLYIDTIERLGKNILPDGDNDEDYNNTNLASRVMDGIEKLITETIDKDISQFVVEYLRKSITINEDNLARVYICSRALPKALVKTNKIFVLEMLAVMMSSMMAWGEMIELVTSLEILKSGNFKEFGFPIDFALKESVSLLLQYGLQPELESLSDCERSDIDEEDFLDDEGFECDICDSKINGLRFHCIECPDFDMCSDCFNNKSYHPHELIEMDVDDSSPECNTQ
ncbi:hypothetical protein KUTeg_018896 [Tegillarca granosa]|uniref:ZZ-type domain-containing protein n=1 Tax=Tegillarca granosa TaxID=220873 RepID=A0ABQ9EG55_TEGGR|nr:hypothetical protein KUTeg_018896 [Tegillarca granosa]